MEDFFEESVEQESSFDIKRYASGIARRWWIVLLATIVVAVPWFLYVKQQPPQFEAEVWVNFENANGNIASQDDSRRRKLQSRTFATEVVAQLGLTIQDLKIDGNSVYDRPAVFSHFSVRKTPEPVPGDYKINLYPTGYASIYHGLNRLDSLMISDLSRDTASYNGIDFVLAPEILDRADQITFRNEPFESAVSSLISRETVTFNGPGTLMKITLRDANPQIAEETLDMLTGLFVQELLEMQRKSHRFDRQLIEDKLRLAEEELNASDLKLKRFRNSHLKGLDQETQEVVTRLERIDGEKRIINEQKDELNLLLGKLDPGSTDFTTDVSVHYVYREIANHSIFDNSSEMTVSRLELADLDRQRLEMLRYRTESHEQVVELSGEINNVEMKIAELAEERIKKMDQDIAELDTEVEELEKQLNSLPGEEIRLVKLSRQRRANEEIHQMLLKRYKEAELDEAVALSNVHIIDPALSRPITGDKKVLAMVGLVFGFGLGLGIAFVMELMDKSIRTRDDISRYLKMPIIGTIPKVKFDDYELQDSEKAKSISSQIVTHDYSPTPVGEAYRVLRTNMLFSKELGSIKSIVVGSMTPGEGKSFTSANLAITLAQQKSNTLLVDADLRRGVLHNTFNCNKKPGLTNYLTGVAPLSSVLQETYIPNLSLITCGSMIPNPSEILGSLRMQKFIEGITKRFDFVVFDTPPLYAATDAVVLGTLADGVAIVVRAGKTNGEEVKRRLELFKNVQAKMVGVILNGAGVEVAHEGYSYYRY